MNITLLLIPFSLSIAHYLGMRWKLHSLSLSQVIQSLSAGLAIAYVFVIMLPEIMEDSETHHFDGMLLVLAGFGLFHVLFKMIVKLSQVDKTKQFLLEELHIAAAALYSLLITFIVIDIIQTDFARGLALFLVIVLHTVLSDVSNLHQNTKYSMELKGFTIIIATLMGGLLSITEIFSSKSTAIIFSFAAGAIIYITIREELPLDTNGKPLFFIVGMVVVVLLDLLLGL